MTIRNWLAPLLVCTALWGCSSGPLKDLGAKISDAVQPKAEKDLAAGVKFYEDGDYRRAAKLLQDSLDGGLNRAADQASAHKYLAFTYCVTSRERLCRDEFKKALNADPGFELDAAEAGHPIWGPVFRGVKAKK
jgi:Tfp pilus assembly protein PilF